MMIPLVLSCTMIDNVRPEKQRTLNVTPLEAQHAYVLPSHEILWLDTDVSELNDDEISSLCNRSRTDSKLKALLNQEKIVYGVLEITPSTIIFNDESVVSINNGKIAEDQTNGFLIEPLFNLLENHHDLNNRLNRYCNTGNKLEKVVLNVHENVPFNVLRAVLYTSGQARFETFVLTRSESMKPYAQAQPTSESRRIEISVTNEASYTIELEGDTTHDFNAEKTKLRTKFDELKTSTRPIGCAVISLSNEVTWKSGHDLVDEIQGFGVSAIYFDGIHNQKETESTFTTHSVTEHQAYAFNLTTDLKVLWISLPKVGEHNEVAESSECFFGVRSNLETGGDRLNGLDDLDKAFQ